MSLRVQCAEIFTSYLGEMQNYISRWLPHQTGDCEKCYFISSKGGMKNKHELCFCCCCNPNSFVANGQVPRATVRGGENVCEKSCWSSHGSISRWCEGCEMIWREKKNLKLSMETIFKEFSEIESPFLGMVNRVVCDEIEFPLSSARNKGARRGRGGLQWWSFNYLWNTKPFGRKCFMNKTQKEKK